MNSRVLQLTAGIPMSVALLAGVALLLVCVVWPSWLRRKQLVSRQVFDDLLQRVKTLRTDGFANHLPPSAVIQARAELVAEARLRLRKETNYFKQRGEVSNRIAFP